MRKNLFNERISSMSGRTGIIASNITYPNREVEVLLDGEKEIFRVCIDDLYFPNHKDGYNQPCFKDS